MTGPAVVIHPEVRKLPTSRSSEALLIEACGLAEAIQLEVIYSEVVKLYAPKANTYLGTGFIELLKKKLVAESIAPIIIVDCTLSPVQQRNLEEILNCKVIDRTALILEIFGARANTHAGRLQVELASLTFQRSRLVRSWTHLERQRGGSGFLGGPGERQIELDRRMLLERVLKIKEELREVERTRDIQRSNRSRTETPTIALVGYTNAGKSTLFNSLTSAKVMAKDMLFATLDPTIRIAAIPSGQKIILADTVGFISELPTELIEAFKSTLEEVTQANFLLHVHDASSQFLEEEEADRDYWFPGINQNTHLESLMIWFGAEDRFLEGSFNALTLFLRDTTTLKELRLEDMVHFNTRSFCEALHENKSLEILSLDLMSCQNIADEGISQIITSLTSHPKLGDLKITSHDKFGELSSKAFLNPPITSTPTIVASK